MAFYRDSWLGFIRRLRVEYYDSLVVSYHYIKVFELCLIKFPISLLAFADSQKSRSHHATTAEGMQFESDEDLQSITLSQTISSVGLSFPHFLAYPASLSGFHTLFVPQTHACQLG
jgi:hypothetical protein